MPGDDYFVVNTVGKQSPIVDAGGAFATCTSVRDAWVSATELGPQRLLFEGEKVVSCDGGKVTIYYEATTASGQGTTGTWHITRSTLDGATSGGGLKSRTATIRDPAKPSGRPESRTATIPVLSAAPARPTAPSTGSAAARPAGRS